MNDIQLTGENNEYDWDFTETDLVDVNGNSALISAVRHSLLLRRNEITQTLYQTKGTRMEEVILSADTESANDIAKQMLEEECRQIEGIQKAVVETTTENNTIQIKKVHITKNDGEEIEIGL